MARATADPMLLATDLADYLVLRGVPFRQAHEVIGKLVALTLERKTGFAELSMDDYRAASPTFGEDVYVGAGRAAFVGEPPKANRRAVVRKRPRAARTLANRFLQEEILRMKKSPLVADKEGWRTVREESKYKDPYMEVTLDEVFTPTRRDKPAHWTVVHRKPAVIVAPMTPAGELVLVRQERIPARLHQWEFPAGQVDDEDSTDEAVVRAAALRELQRGNRLRTRAAGVRVDQPGILFQLAGFHGRAQPHVSRAREWSMSEGRAPPTTRAKASRSAGRSGKRSFAGWWRRANSTTRTRWACTRGCARGGWCEAGGSAAGRPRLVSRRR